MDPEARADPRLVPSEALPAPDTDGAGRFIGTVLAFARVAEGFARRTAGGFLVLAVCGLVASAWLAYYGRNVLGLPAWLNLPLALGMGAPPLVLFLLQRILHEAIGLPDRVLEMWGRLYQGARGVGEAFADRAARPRGEKKERFRDLMRTGRALWALRGASDEALEALAVARGTAVLWNPLFPMLLFATSVLTGLLCATACAALLLVLLL